VIVTPAIKPMLKKRFVTPVITIEATMKMIAPRTPELAINTPGAISEMNKYMSFS